MSWESLFKTDMVEAKGKKKSMTPGMVKHYARLNKESSFHTCSDCDLTIGKYPGRYPKWCPNCGTDMSEQEGYPSKTLVKSGVDEPVIAESFSLRGKVEAANTLEEVCRYVHESLRYKPVPWSPNYQVIHPVSITESKLRFAVYAPFVELTNRAAGSIVVEGENIKVGDLQETLRAKVRKVIQERLVTLKSITKIGEEQLPRNGFDVPANGETGQQGPTASLPIGEEDDEECESGHYGVASDMPRKDPVTAKPESKGMYTLKGLKVDETKRSPSPKDAGWVSPDGGFARIYLVSASGNRYFNKVKEVWREVLSYSGSKVKGRKIPSTNKGVKEVKAAFFEGRPDAVSEQMGSSQGNPEDGADAQNMQTSYQTQNVPGKAKTEDGEKEETIDGLPWQSDQPRQSWQESFAEEMKESVTDGQDGDYTDDSEVGTRRFVSSCAVVIKGNDVLLGVASTDDDRDGKLCFPGGGVDEEDGGCPRAAAEREVYEEMGIEVLADGPVLEHPDHPKVAFVVCRFISGDLHPSPEFSDAEWYPLSTTDGLPTIYPSNKHVLHQVPQAREEAKKDKRVRDLSPGDSFKFMGQKHVVARTSIRAGMVKITTKAGLELEIPGSDLALNEKVKPLPVGQADAEELAMGIMVELEHTDNAEEAQKIALDHLRENPKYYSELKGCMPDEVPDVKECGDMLAFKAAKGPDVSESTKELIDRIADSMGLKEGFGKSMTAGKPANKDPRAKPGTSMKEPEKQTPMTVPPAKAPTLSKPALGDEEPGKPEVPTPSEMPEDPGEEGNQQAAPGKAPPAKSPDSSAKDSRLDKWSDTMRDISNDQEGDGNGEDVKNVDKDVPPPNGDDKSPPGPAAPKQADPKSPPKVVPPQQNGDETPPPQQVPQPGAQPVAPQQQVPTPPPQQSEPGPQQAVQQPVDPSQVSPDGKTAVVDPSQAAPVPDPAAPVDPADPNAAPAPQDPNAVTPQQADPNAPVDPNDPNAAPGPVPVDPTAPVSMGTGASVDLVLGTPDMAQQALEWMQALGVNNVFVDGTTLRVSAGSSSEVDLVQRVASAFGLELTGLA